METKRYGSCLTNEDLEVRVNQLAGELKQEIQKLSDNSDASIIGVAEMFVRKLLKQLKVPMEGDY